MHNTKMMKNVDFERACKKEGIVNESLSPFSIGYMPCWLMGKSCQHSTLLENNLITPYGGSCWFQIFGKVTRSILTSAQIFGEICITTYQNNSHQAKLANFGTQEIQVGFAEGHPVDTYHVYNSKTKISLLEDMIFLKNMVSGHGWKTCVSSNEVVKVVLACNENNNNYYDVVRDSNKDEESKDNFFEVQVKDEVKVTLKTTFIWNWCILWKICKLCFWRS